MGSVLGFSVAYFRLRWMNRHIDRQVFCTGTLIQQGEGEKPSPVVYSKKFSTAEEDNSVENNNTNRQT